MEIISIVLAGQLAHQDSLGNGRVIGPGEIQYMSAGTGFVHSEYNPSKDEAVHFLQIWIQPDTKQLVPRYADQPMLGTVDDAWALILSADGRDGSMAIRQDVTLRTARLRAGSELTYTVEAAGRGLWLFIMEGQVSAAESALATGDSLALTQVPRIRIRNTAASPAKLLLFDLKL